MTFLELIQTVKDEFGPDDGAWIGRYKRFLNRGVREIANYRRWSFLSDFGNTVSTVAGTEEYTLADTDLKTLLSVRLTTDGFERRLYPISYQAFRDIHPNVSTTADRGVPEYVYTTGRTAAGLLKVKLFPVPDRVYTVEYDYVKTPADMSDDADVPVFPSAYHDLLVDYTLWKCFQHKREFPTSEAYRAQFSMGLREMAGDYLDPESVEQQVIAYDGEDVE